MLRIIKAIIILVILGAGIAGYSYWQGINEPVGNINEEKIFEIKEGQGVKKISQELFNSGVIKSKLYFEYYILQNKWQAKMMAGEYKFKNNSTIKDIAKSLVTGDALNKEKTVLIKEGLNSNEIGIVFEKEGIFTKELFLRIVGYPRVDYSSLESAEYPSIVDHSDEFPILSDKPDNVSYEGYLFPDTYRFYKYATPDEVLLKMLDNFDRKLTVQMRQDIVSQNKTIFQIVIMASLIEKEVRNTDAMKMVSGIFWNRIRNDQRLESCASLAYILGVNKPQYSIEDTEVNSPYNTYRYKGLPPGPISNPGLNAIMAAIYPNVTDYNYFLTATDGKTIYAKTFEEHILNKNKYLR